LESKIKKLSPLTEATFYIMLALNEPLHGYGIIKKVDQMSRGRIRLAAGTLYGAFNNLQKHKLIQLIGVDPENQRRKIYKLTDEGYELIQYEVERLNSMVLEGKKELGETV
jgi:DNA-binding PadR family transcriptional regulator